MCKRLWGRGLSVKEDSGSWAEQRHKTCLILSRMLGIYWRLQKTWASSWDNSKIHTKEKLNMSLWKCIDYRQDQLCECCWKLSLWILFSEVLALQFPIEKSLSLHPGEVARKDYFHSWAILQALFSRAWNSESWSQGRSAVVFEETDFIHGGWASIAREPGEGRRVSPQRPCNITCAVFCWLQMAFSMPWGSWLLATLISSHLSSSSISKERRFLTFWLQSEKNFKHNLHGTNLSHILLLKPVTTRKMR